MRTNFLNSSIDYTSIKICGLKDEECVDVAVAAGADAIGFVFVEDSPRHVDRDTAEQLITQLPTEVIPIAVLQNEKYLDSFSDWSGILQLCGDETEELIASLNQPVIKAFKWDPDELLRWDAFGKLEAILIDGSTGGLGKTFDVSELVAMLPLIETPIIVAGGLTPLNVGQVISEISPAAVDVSSGVESVFGVKDPSLICEFINAVRDQ